MIWGINGILYAQPISDVISTIITVLMAAHLHKELNAIKSDPISTIDERHSSTLN